MNRLVPLFVFVTLIFAGCNSNPKVKAPLKLYVFECGRLNYASIKPFGITDNETEVRELIVPCYIIEHEKGRLLWEGDYHRTLQKLTVGERCMEAGECDWIGHLESR